MCGFSGFMTKPNESIEYEKLLNTMCDSIRHRGPDDYGIWFKKESGIGMAHTRLAVVDLSPAGHQPMRSSNGRYAIVFNGEVYNHLNLRDELKIDKWRGHSDTETLLAGFEVWGIESTISRSIGMFAFVVWDELTKTLTLGRDRAGEKPLYYGWQNDVFLFGSELKSLKTHPSFDNLLDHGALALYLRHNYIPAPHSIYKNIYKLIPGSLLQVSLNKTQSNIITYWSPLKSSSNLILCKDDESEIVNELERLAKSAIMQQMVADVPIGAFLSGGIDSSTVVALMQAQSSTPVRTFSIGFNEAEYNEAKYAKKVAAYLGTSHTELYVSTNQALDVIPKLPALYDEPFADSSQIPTFLISELAKRQVTVALTGDAGDELFCGYNRYKISAKLWSKIKKIPAPIRNGTSKTIKKISPDHIDMLASLLSHFGINKSVGLGAKFHKGASLLKSSSLNEAYNNIVSHHHTPFSLLIEKGVEPNTYLSENLQIMSELGEVEQMMVMDFISYLPDDILVKVDRAAMGVSLETRIPFLDHRIIEFASNIPLSLKLKDGQTKWILRQILYKYVPRDLIERPKMGFGIPLSQWLQGPLKEWAETLLDERNLYQSGVFNIKIVREMWHQFIKGRTELTSLLWSVLMFQAWFEHNEA